MTEDSPFQLFNGSMECTFLAGGWGENVTTSGYKRQQSILGMASKGSHCIWCVMCYQALALFFFEEAYFPANKTHAGQILTSPWLNKGELVSLM